MKTNRLKNRKGTAMIEAAFLLPIFCLLLVGILEFGRVLMLQQMLNNAAREAARVGAIQFDDEQALNSADEVAQEYLIRCGVNLERVVIEPVFSDVNGSEAVEVHINYEYGSRIVSWVPGLNNSLNLHSAVVMRREI